jgi:predicted acyltransferase
MKSQVAATNRLVSIDALRGFDMFWIMGGDLLARHVCGRLRETSHSNTVFGRFAKFVGELQPQFDHVEWHGFVFYDLIYPLFLFLVGVVLPFSLGKYGEGPSPGAYGRVFRRTFALIALGLIYNGFLQFTFASKGWSEVRLPGVLQRIGLCYFFAALIVMHFRPAMQMVFFVAILGLYYAALTFIPAGDHAAGDLTKEGNLAGWLDRKLLGGTFLYYGYGDNEGVLSTIPAVATTLLGALAGALLRGSNSPLLRVLVLLTGGAACVQLGWWWEQFGGFPVNKILWTSSFVLVAGGWSLILLGAFHFIIDVCGLKGWAYFFTVIGANAIAIYMLEDLVDWKHSTEFLFGGIASLAGEPNKTLILIVGAISLKWLVLWFLYRQRVFFRV